MDFISHDELHEVVKYFLAKRLLYYINRFKNEGITFLAEWKIKYILTDDTQ